MQKHQYFTAIKGSLRDKISDMTDQITNVLELVIHDIEDHKANIANEIKQLQRLRSARLEEIEEHINQRASESKGNKDKDIEELKKVIEKLKEKNIRFNDTHIGKKKLVIILFLIQNKNILM